MTTMISVYGTASQKGSVMGVFRALGALARALGPMTTCAGKSSSLHTVINYNLHLYDFVFRCWHILL